MQQDAEECYSQLVSNLKDDLKVKVGERDQSFVETFMTGQFVSSLKSDEAPTEDPIVTSEPFGKLSCHISSGK
jgi:ubiquitin carboxyl-terminal hydrolase 14